MNYENIYEKLYVTNMDVTPSEIEAKIESVSTDFEKKVILCSVFDTPKLRLDTPEWKVVLRKYKKEILEIRELNKPFTDISKSPDGPLPYTPGWIPQTESV